MRLPPRRGGTPQAEHRTFLGTDPEKDNVAGEITVGILQSHDINIKPTGDLGVLYRQMCFVKMHCPLHGLTRVRRLLLGPLINCPPSMTRASHVRPKTLRRSVLLVRVCEEREHRPRGWRWRGGRRSQSRGETWH